MSLAKPLALVLCNLTTERETNGLPHQVKYMKYTNPIGIPSMPTAFFGGMSTEKAQV
jgi:hypothetical protein